MRLPRVALILLAATGPALAAQRRAPIAATTPTLATGHYRVTGWDGVAIGVGGAVAAIPELAGLPKGRSPCLPCDPHSLVFADHAALHTFSSGANTASSVLLAGVVGLSGLASLEGATAAQARGHAAVFANSLVWSLAAAEWLKALVHRARPVLYVTRDTAAASDVENRRSFPSGHASLAFAAATSYLAIAAREHLPHRARNAISLFAGAVGVAALRVAAGKHFPTDVAGGAALGSAVGWLAAQVHPTMP